MEESSFTVRAKRLEHLLRSRRARRQKQRENWRLLPQVLLATLSLALKPLKFAYQHAGIGNLPRSQRGIISVLILGLVFVPIFDATPTAKAEDAMDSLIFDERELMVDEGGYIDKYQTEELTPQWEEYLVQEGDTVASIAEDFGIKKATLEAVNRSKVRDLRVGDKLYIPPYEEGVMHYATRGDSLNSLARMYGVTPEAISLANDGDESIKYDKYYFIPNGKFVNRSYVSTTGRDGGYAPSSLPNKSVNSAGWILPLDSYTYMRGWKAGHTGVDLSIRTGTPIYAVSDGVVEMAKYDGWNGGYGKVVKLNHAGGISTLYAHMSQVNVQSGESVSKGQVIGLVGSTGRSTGPHLHFEVHEGSRKVDPWKYLQF